MEIDHQKFENLIRKHGLDVERDMDGDLEMDLNVTGDDAIELLQEYQKVFGVKMDKFKFEEYFHDEASFVIFSFKKFFGFKRRKKKKLTIRMLQDAIHSGILS